MCPKWLITSVGRTHSKNGRPDLLSVPTRANVVSGRQYGRLLAHSVSQNPLATTPSGSAWRKNLRAQPARPPRPSDDVSRSHPGARGAPGNHGPSHRRAERPVSLAGGIAFFTARSPCFCPCYYSALRRNWYWNPFLGD